MSYGVAAALQAAVYQKLLADAALGALVGGAVYDAVPPGTTTGTYVSLGPEDVLDASDKTGDGATHDFVISVITDEAGFALAKAVAAAVSDALVDADLTLTRGRLVWLHFVKAQAKRLDAGAARRIDLRFAARVED